MYQCLKIRIPSDASIKRFFNLILISSLILKLVASLILKLIATLISKLIMNSIMSVDAVAILIAMSRSIIVIFVLIYIPDMVWLCNGTASSFKNS